MPQLYTIRFTTQKLVSKFDNKNKLISATQLDMPICMTALPLATAMSYSGCDNYKREIYQFDDRGPSTAKWGAPAPAARARMKRTSADDFDRDDTTVSKKPKRTKADKLTDAAKTGNLAAAVNQ